MILNLTKVPMTSASPVSKIHKGQRPLASFWPILSTLTEEIFCTLCAHWMCLPASAVRTVLVSQFRMWSLIEVELR